MDGVWWLYDDDEVTPVNPSVVLKQNAYMLFYKKKTDNLKGSQVFATSQFISTVGTKKGIKT